jgi:hypothetical protein
VCWVRQAVSAGRSTVRPKLLVDLADNPIELARRGATPVIDGMQVPAAKYFSAVEGQRPPNHTADAMVGADCCFEPVVARLDDFFDEATRVNAIPARVCCGCGDASASIPHGSCSSGLMSRSIIRHL